MYRSSAALIRCASARPRAQTELVRHSWNAFVEKTSSLRVTATGTWTRASVAASRGPAGTSFWDDVTREVSDRSTHHLGVLLEERVALRQLSQLNGLITRQARGLAGLDVVELELALQARLGDTEVLRDLRD